MRHWIGLSLAHVTAFHPFKNQLYLNQNTKRVFREKVFEYVVYKSRAILFRSHGVILNTK